MSFDTEDMHNQNNDADDNNMYINDRDVYHVSEADGRAGAEDVFMDSGDGADDDDLTRIVKSLNQLGVDLLDAQTYVDSISTKQSTFIEVYGRGGTCDES